MLAILIIIISAMAVVAVAYNSYLGMLNSSSQMTKALEERRLINDWSLSIQRSMRPFGLNRELVVPNGELSEDGDYLLPPSSINLQTKNAWGNELIYCPYSMNTAGGADSIKAGDGESYLGELITGSDGIEYVYSVSEDADPTGTDLIAMIISPIPSETSPSCNDIRFDSVEDSYYVTNYDGIVHAITYSALVVSNQAQSVDVKSGVDESLFELTEDWSSVLPDVLNIDVASGGAPLSSETVLFVNESTSKSKSIVIRGEDISTSILSGTDSSIIFNNVTVKITDVTFSSGVELSFINSDVTLENVVMNDATFDGSKIFSTGYLGLISNDSPVEFVNTELNGSDLALNLVKNNTSIGISAIGSKITADDFSITNSQANGVGVLIGNSSSLDISDSISSSGSYLDSVLSITSGGSINLTNNSIVIGNPVDTFMFNQGDVSLSSSIVSFSSSAIRGIILGLNSDTVLNDVQLGITGNSPSVGVIDIGGAKFVAGFNTYVGSTVSCWSGDIFENTSVSSSGSSSEPTVDANKNSNRSVWTCSI
jgi:hypothetical protein